eukprot:3442908-Rhodomonas_salina.3
MHCFFSRWMNGTKKSRFKPTQYASSVPRIAYHAHRPIGKNCVLHTTLAQYWISHIVSHARLVPDIV